MKDDPTLSELTEAVVKSFAKYDKQGTLHWTWETAAADLPYQVGSLSKVILQIAGKRYSEGKTKKQLDWQLRNELADILAEVLYIAHKLNIDMNKAILEMVDDDDSKVKSRTQSK
jgi:NTP pyrophosphatase (non-canonical NTP hydrolase)